jgi:flagellar hook assembly protein FlgD
MHPAGVHAPRWDGRDEEGRKVAPGVYFARLATAGGSTDAQRIVVLE